MVDLPIKKGFLHLPEGPYDKPYLVGSKCNVCGYNCFPKKEVCVKCRLDDSMEEIRIGERAKLETYALLQVGTSDFSAPYFIGYVRTEEGVLIFTQITGAELRDDALRIGDEMELIIEMVKKDSKGNNLIGWKYRPRQR